MRRVRTVRVRLRPGDLVVRRSQMQSMDLLVRRGERLRDKLPLCVVVEVDVSRRAMPVCIVRCAGDHRRVWHSPRSLILVDLDEWRLRVHSDIELVV